jgi:hypothetical protein
VLYSSNKFQYQTVKVGTKSRFFEVLLLCATVLSCMSRCHSQYIYTFAGDGTEGYYGDGGPATSAELYIPNGVTVSSTYQVYIGDSANNRIRVVYTNGTITTFAGTGTAGYSGDGGPATSAELNNPFGVTVSSTGEVYIADTYNSRIRVVVDSSSVECSNQGYYQNQSYCICSNGVMNSCSSCYGINSGSSSICSGHGQCVSPNNCSCNSGYTGYNCQLNICYGINQTSTNVCSGNGQCVSPNNCSCNSGYTGYNCQLNICYGINQTSSNVCSGHGQCVSPNNCSCDSGYTGYECQLISCNGVNQTSPNVCSGNGQCISPNNCSCDSGYSGYYCELTICYGVNETSINVCSGHGQCISPNNCSCDVGYVGYDCQLSICYGINETSSDVCSGHGTCTSFNNCNCTNGFTGENCQHVSFAIKLVVNFVLLSLILAHLIL